MERQTFIFKRICVSLFINFSIVFNIFLRLYIISGNCSSGYYCPGSPEQIDTDTPGQFACPLGHRCEVGAIGPERCPSGTFQDSIAMSDCKVVSVGRVDCNRVEKIKGGSWLK